MTHFRPAGRGGAARTPRRAPWRRGGSPVTQFPLPSVAAGECWGGGDSRGRGVGGHPGRGRRGRGGRGRRGHPGQGYAGRFPGREAGAAGARRRAPAGPWPWPWAGSVPPRAGCLQRAACDLPRRQASSALPCVTGGRRPPPPPAPTSAAAPAAAPAPTPRSGSRRRQRNRTAVPRTAPGAPGERRRPPAPGPAMR